MTIGDKIRNTDNSQLAEFLASDHASACEHCEYLSKDVMCKGCAAPDGFTCTKEYASAILKNWLDCAVPQPDSKCLEKESITMQEARNAVDSLIGCKNRMFITDDNEELEQLYVSAKYHLGLIYKANCERLNKEYGNRQNPGHSESPG